MHYAGQALTMRAQSAAELRTRLLKKGTAADVDSVLSKLKEAGYLDDSKFAAAYAGWRKDNEGFGRGRVLRDLIARKVPTPVAKAASEAAFRETDEVEMIEAFLARKFRGKNLAEMLKEEKGLASAYRRLRTAGFSTSNSIRVLKRFSYKAEQLEDSEPTEES